MHTFLRSIRITVRKVPSIVWRLTTLALLALLVGGVWMYAPSRQWLAVQLGMEASAAEPTTPTEVATTPPDAALQEKVTDLEGKLADLQKAQADQTIAVAALQQDFQKAVAEVSQTNDELQKQADNLASWANTLGAHVDQSTGSNTNTEGAQSSPSGATSQSAKVNINKGSAADLDTLPGIGPSYAQKIIDYREKNGPYKTVDELENVSGIGPATVTKLRDLVEL